VNSIGRKPTRFIDGETIPGSKRLKLVIHQQYNSITAHFTGQNGASEFQFEANGCLFVLIGTIYVLDQAIKRTECERRHSVEAKLGTRFEGQEGKAANLITCETD